jgi:hypothetical protein
VEPTHDYCNSQWQLNCGEESCECAASVRGTEAENCEERGESTNKEDGMQNGRLSALER